LRGGWSNSCSDHSEMKSFRGGAGLIPAPTIRKFNPFAEVLV
jgi:hypothetical protein